MEFYTEGDWAKKSVLFAEDVGDVFLKDIPDNNPVTLLFFYNEVGTVVKGIKITLLPHNGRIRLKLRDFIKAAPEATLPRLQQNEEEYTCCRMVLLVENNYEIGWYPVTDNGSSAGTILMGHVSPTQLERVLNGCFLTRQPQISKIYAKAQHCLNLLLPPSEKPFRLEITSYFKNLCPITEYQIINAWDKAATVRIVDCSIDAIKHIGSLSAISDDIKAFDITIYASQDNEGNEWAKISEPRRFIVSRRDSGRDFRFRGYFGLFENIHSVSTTKQKFEQDVKTFVSDNLESELSNNSKYIYEDGSGYISDPDEIGFWNEFLSSSERYVWSDGDWQKIIVDEVKSETSENTLNTITFKWHFADSRQDQILPQTKELEPYISNHDISEL